MNSSGKLLVTITVDELNAIIENAVHRKITELIPKPPEKYLNGKEVMEKFRITRPTFISYRKQGFFTKHTIGNKNLYKESEVESALVTFQKYQRKKIA